MVATIPECQCEAESAFAVGDSHEPIFSPSVRPAGRMFVGKGRPRIASVGIIFANGGPLSFGEVRTPPFPVFLPGSIFLQTLKFFVHILLRSPSAVVVGNGVGVATLRYSMS